MKWRDAEAAFKGGGKAWEEKKKKWGKGAVRTQSGFIDASAQYVERR